MGIPLLHPWANRLGGFAYAVDGVDVTIDRDSPEIRLEEHGLPIARAAQRAARVGGRRGRRGAGWWPGATCAGLAEFPFDHRVEVAAELAGGAADGHHDGRRRRATARCRSPSASTRTCVLPGVPRAEWEIELPVREHLLLDENLIPDRASASRPASSTGRSASRTFDDGYTVDPAGVTFVLAGGGRRIEVAFEQGYPFAQIFAPDVEDVICFEPMTAPADALRHSPGTVAPGRHLHRALQRHRVRRLTERAAACSQRTRRPATYRHERRRLKGRNRRPQRSEIRRMARIPAVLGPAGDRGALTLVLRPLDGWPRPQLRRTSRGDATVRALRQRFRGERSRCTVTGFKERTH